MTSSLLLTFILAWTLCVSEADAHWFRRYDTSHQSQAWQSEQLAAAASSSSYQSYHFSLPAPSVIEPTLTSQGMVVSSVIPLYEICNTPGLDTTSCSTVFETTVTTACSTVLTYAFTQATVSDCSQNITFSTQSSYSLVTTTISPDVTPAPLNQPLATTTYIQSIVSYYIAPWQALAANTPSNVTVLVCEYDLSGSPICTTIQEVWVVSTVHIPVITTSTLIISTTLSSPAVLLLGPTDTITATAGLLYVSTEITYTSISPNATTSISTILPTSTSFETLTITSTLPPKTITITLSSVTPTPEPSV
ncbi:hypothetical protein L207DRAFT_55307 [Hyaloscypha variabilis F]|uniref:Uncharacterized protein n=1 Tax=Hyaloscypha variabilis (strain UAMH 11265 / GT02V1 / F) TaxID=1149755 RepID=A0A2J6RL27_HYAVF|nr:hypothetical protein L207DRAFT_55307 [Hyaloscypha variabilis F]